MRVLGIFTAMLYVVGGLCILSGFVIAGLSLAAPYMFSVNLLDARAYTVDYLGWMPGVEPENERIGAVALATAMLVSGISIAGLGTLMMTLPAFA